jgi:hypothetical protein
MLIAIAKHLGRQRRVDETVRDALGVGPEVVARSGWGALPEHVSRGAWVEGSRGAFLFLDRGIRFHDRGRHEILEIDLRDGDVEHVDVQLLADCLRHIPGSRDGDTRLWMLHASYETFGFAFDELVELGLLELHPRAPHLARVPAEVEPHLVALRDFGWRFGADHYGGAHGHLAMAARIGDWIEADRLAERRGDNGKWARVFTRPRAAEQAAERRARLLALAPVDRAGTAITALVELDAMAAAPHVREALAGPLDGRCATVLRTIRCYDDTPWSPTPDYGDDVLALFRRIDPQGMGFEYLIWPLCARFLLDRGLHVEEVLAAFPSLGDALAPHGALVAFDHAPDLAAPLLRRALHARVPTTRADAAAVLVLLGEPWCAATLAEALGASADPAPAFECRAALRMMHDPDGAARAWEAAHPLTGMDERWSVGVEVWIQQRMDELYPEVEPIRRRRRAGEQTAARRS